MTFFVVSSQPSCMARRLYCSLGIAEESGGRDLQPDVFSTTSLWMKPMTQRRWRKRTMFQIIKDEFFFEQLPSTTYVAAWRDPPKIGQTADFMDLRFCCSHARLGCHNQRMSCGSRSQGRFFALGRGVFWGFPQVRRYPPYIHQQKLNFHT